MELWVRSQSKENLLKIKNLSIDNENKILGNLISDDNKSICDYWILGTYKSKERALEIIDEIQNILKPQIIAHIQPSEEMAELLGGLQYGKTLKMKNDFEYKELSTYVYEMPDE